MATATLIGVREVTSEELRVIPCPPPEGRWYPVPHATVVDFVTSALHDAGYGLEQLKIGLSRGDARLFGVGILRCPLVPGVQLAIGFRSSFDRSLSLQWAQGSRVFACGNMAFRSEQVIARKHTRHGSDRYREAILRCIGELKSFRDAEAQRIRLMQHRIVSDHFAEAFLLRAYQDEQILSPRSLPAALKEWREPSFPDFQEQKNVWRLYNAVTFALGDRAQTNPQAHAAATIRLGALLAPEAAEALPLPSLAA